MHGISNHRNTVSLLYETDGQCLKDARRSASSVCLALGIILNRTHKNARIGTHHRALAIAVLKPWNRNPAAARLGKHRPPPLLECQLSQVSKLGAVSSTLPSTHNAMRDAPGRIALALFPVRTVSDDNSMRRAGSVRFRPSAAGRCAFGAPRPARLQPRPPARAGRYPLPWSRPPSPDQFAPRETWTGRQCPS